MKRLTAILVAILIGCGGGDGTNPASGTSAGTVGDACGGSGDCKLFGGVSAICMKETIGGYIKWWNGYCTFGCNTKNPKCPEGRVCFELDSYLDAPRCLRPCGDNSDCRAGYECSSAAAVCVPTDTPPPPPPPDSKCNSTNCSGCCDDDGKCQPGDTDAACNKNGAMCFVCGPQEHCTMGNYFNLCYCRNNCEGGCCDPATGACMPGTADTACGDLNFQCYVCGSDEKCALDSSGSHMSCSPK